MIALSVKVIAGLVAMGVGIHLVRWQRRTRAAWREYDERYDEAPRATRASLRARRER